MIGAVEAQKAEGVLHLHFSLLVQMAHQFNTLHDIAERLRTGLLSEDAMKTYFSKARCAAYPDADRFQQERASIEEAWPAYAQDTSLSLPPPFAYSSTAQLTAALGAPAWREEGEEWKRQYNNRLQHVLSRMNHHVHPIKNQETGERRPLRSCLRKGKGELCKSGFPLENELCDKPVLVCACIADLKNLSATGPRSLLGTVLPERNDPWLNAGPTAWLVFSADNGHIKFPHRLPITVESHENMLLFDCQRQPIMKAKTLRPTGSFPLLLKVSEQWFA